MGPVGSWGFDRTWWILMGPDGSWRVLRGQTLITQPILIRSCSNFAWINLRCVPLGPEVLIGPDGSWRVLMGPEGSCRVLKGPEGSWRVLTCQTLITRLILIGSCSNLAWINLRWVLMDPDWSWWVLTGPDRSNFNNSANSYGSLLKFGLNQPKMSPSGSWVFYRT